MSAKPAAKLGKWKAGAWTPRRCAVWRALEGDAKLTFEAWVHAEVGFGYATELSPEHEPLIS